MLNPSQRKLSFFINSFLSAAFFFSAWQLLALHLLSPYLPFPLQVITRFFTLLFSGNLLLHFTTSFLRILASMALAFTTAVPLGFFLGRSSAINELISPTIYLLYPIPKIVFLPLLIICWGLGNMPKIFLISLIIFFQILVTVRDSAKSIPLQYILSLQALHASKHHLFYHVMWPYCLPAIFTSLRLALGTSVAVLFFAETFTAVDGLGYLILDNMERRDYASMYAAISAMGFLGITFYTLLDIVERKLCSWNNY